MMWNRICLPAVFDKAEKTSVRRAIRGSSKLAGTKAVITGGDSGTGRAVGTACARKGADVLIAYFNERGNAKEAQRLVEKQGERRC
jgi:hypothetical protein